VVSGRREFQRCYQLADKRRAEQPGALADDQRAAWESLAKCHRALGADGSALVNDLLIRGMTAKQIAASRGLAGEERFFAKRF
jgi:hypothetical protein